MKRSSNTKLSSLLGASRASRAIARSSICLLLLMCLLVAANVAVACLPNSIAKPDVSGRDTFRLSQDTYTLLDKLDEEVTLYYLCSGGANAADGDLYAFFARYAEASPMVKLKVVDTAKDTEFLAAHGGTLPSDMSVVVESAKRYKLIDNLEFYYYYLYDSSYGELIMTPLEYATLLESISQSDTTGETLAYLSQNVKAYFNGEYCVTNAVSYVTLDRVASAFVLNGDSSATPDAALTEYLTAASFDVFSVNTLLDLPNTCDVLVLHSLQADLSEDTAKALADYLENGGKLLLTTSVDQTALPNLAAVLKNYGLEIPENAAMVCEGHTNYLPSTYPYLFYAHLNAQHAFSSELDGSFLVFGAHPILLTETEGVTLTPWLTTSSVGYLADPSTGKQTEGSKATYTVGAIAEKGDTKIVWISASASFLSQINDSAADANFELFLQSLNQLSGVTSNTLSFAARSIDSEVLTVSSAQFVAIGILTVVILPLAFAGIGIGIRYVRKKR